MGFKKGGWEEGYKKNQAWRLESRKRGGRPPWGSIVAPHESPAACEYYRFSLLLVSPLVVSSLFSVVMFWSFLLVGSSC